MRNAKFQQKLFEMVGDQGLSGKPITAVTVALALSITAKKAERYLRRLAADGHIELSDEADYSGPLKFVVDLQDLPSRKKTTRRLRAKKTKRRISTFDVGDIVSQIVDILTILSIPAVLWLYYSYYPHSDLSLEEAGGNNSWQNYIATLILTGIVSSFVLFLFSGLVWVICNTLDLTDEYLEFFHDEGALSAFARFLILPSFIYIPLFLNHLFWAELCAEQSTLLPRFAWLFGPWFAIVLTIFFAYIIYKTIDTR